jgi:cell pole-organizing protein PopZ
MAYTLTQARALLTAPELALFDASRTEPIKALTPAGLRAKVLRARTARDKYRDLYRRQTVSTRSAPARQRSAVGGDNDRTQRKADIFAEVLTRFENRVTQLQAAQDKLAAKAQKDKAKTEKDKATAKDASKTSKAKTVPLKTAVAKALKKQAEAPASTAPTRSDKAPAAKRPGRGTVSAAPPLDVPPGNERANPLRQRADNQAIHAHTKSQTRRAQGKRDSS